MKIAICYSGLSLRLIEYPGVLKLQLDRFQNHEVDLFFSLWLPGRPGDELRTIINSKIAEVGNPNIKIANLTLTKKPEAKLKYRKFHLWSKGNSVDSIFGMYTSIKNVDSLRRQYEEENNFKYDLVIKSRPDIGLDGVIDLNHIKELLDTECMAVFPQDYNWFSAWHGNGGMLNDQFFISTSDIMSLITDIDIDQCCDEGCRFHPESILWWKLVRQIPVPDHLKDKEIPQYKFLPFDTLLKGKDKEMVVNDISFSQENIEKFKLDKIFESIGFTPNVQT